MTRLYTLAASLVLAVCSSTAAATTGRQVLDQCAHRLKEAPALKVAYTATADGHKSRGTLVVQGDKFTITSPQMMSWYDGRTQWTFSAQTGEVNIITPTADELSQINPLAILRNVTSAYTPGTPVTQQGKTTVRLTARDAASDIRTVTLTVNDATHYPSRIVLGLGGNQAVTLDITSIEAGKALPDKIFRFDSSQFPGIEVVDLR